MTDTFKPSLKIGNSLLAGTKQDLRLEIRTDRSVRVGVPLGEAATALMTVEQFNDAALARGPLSESDKLRPELGTPQRARSQDNKVGYISIPVTIIDEPPPPGGFAFNLWLRNFIVQKGQAQVTIALEAEGEVEDGPPWVPVDPAQTAQKMEQQPRITSFTPDPPRYNARSGARVTLKWTIEPPGNYGLKCLNSRPGSDPLDKSPQDQQRGGGQWVGNVSDAQQDFVLEAWTGAKPDNPDTRQVHIDTRFLTKFDGYELSWPPFTTTVSTTVAASTTKETLLTSDTTGFVVGASIVLEPGTPKLESARIEAIVSSTSIEVAFPPGGARYTHTANYTVLQARTVTTTVADKTTADILGLYADRSRGRLYALLRFEDAPYAALWYTEHGFSPDRSQWREAARKGAAKPLIPVAAARRPGAIFDGKLFLIGGDCCSPNLSGREMGWCVLNEDWGLYWQPVPANDPWSWPKDMNERMGHAVVTLPDNKGLWVMGGWRQDGGVCNDVWQFDGSANAPWKRVEGLRLPRCLFGATATPAAVWTLGGFASPGGAPSDATVRRCTHGATSWGDLPAEAPKVPDINIKEDHEYVASVLFSRDRNPKEDKPYGVAAFWSTKNNRPTERYFYFEKVESWQNPDIEETRHEIVFQNRKWYHLQAAVFREAVFFRTLIPDENWASNVMTYLVFKPD